MSVTSDHDLVVFDIDGTLLATDEFWVEIGERSVAAAYERRGIDRDLPPRRRFVDAIGLPMSEFWRFILPPEAHDLADEVEAQAQELEELAFSRGLGVMYPGARDLIADLHAAGRFVGVASNCGQRYLDGFLRAFGLGELVDVARCVDTPGMRSKADMIADIVERTAATRPVMVGDRANDRDAAAANGVPFVLFGGGFLPTEPADGDLVVRTYGELRAVLLPESRT